MRGFYEKKVESKRRRNETDTKNNRVTAHAVIATPATYFMRLRGGCHI